MVEKLISFSRNRMVVLIVSACLFGWGIYSVQQNPIDAILTCPKIKLFFTEWMGRSPQVIEDQVTYPLVSLYKGIPKLRIFIFVHVWDELSISFFEDDVDPYWARTRVLERLNYAQRLLPSNVVPTLET
jgi:Cu(I)/Ag(I) efflux system membrane protein CusA/SilA